MAIQQRFYLGYLKSFFKKYIHEYSIINSLIKWLNSACKGIYIFKKYINKTMLNEKIIKTFLISLSLRETKTIEVHLNICVIYDMSAI